MTERLNRSYDREEIDRGLLVVAVCGGNTSLAARRLRDAGHPIPERTLNDWSRVRHVARYVELSNEHGREIEDVVVAQSRAIAVEAGEAERELLAVVRSGAAKLNPGEAAGALRNVTVMKGVNVDKVMLMTGRPTEITENRTSDDIMRALAQKVPALARFDVDAHGEEEQPADLMPSTQEAS